MFVWVGGWFLVGGVDFIIFNFPFCSVMWEIYV